MGCLHQFSPPVDCSRVGKRDGQGFAPGQARLNAGESGSLIPGQPQEEVSIRLKALRGQGDKNLEIADGAHGGEVERRRRRGVNPIFQAFGAHLNLAESTGSGSFLEEGSLFRCGLEQGDGDPWESDFQGQAGEAGATADVEKFAPKLRVPGKEKAFAKMAHHTLFRVADRREVDFPIPDQ